MFTGIVSDIGTILSAEQRGDLRLVIDCGYDVDAIALTMASLAGSTVAMDVAVTAITLAAVTNTLVKLCIAYLLGTREFGNRMAAIFLPIVLVGLAVIFLQ